MILQSYKKIAGNISDNEYVFMQIEVRSGKSTHHINKECSDGTFKSIIDFINKSEMDDLIFVCRHKNEWNTNEYPSESQMEILKSTCTKKYKIFYQDPWPNHVPKFSSDKTVIRFGYNEGSKIDNMASTWIDMRVLSRFDFDDDRIVDNFESKLYFVLLGKNEIHELGSEDIPLI